MGKKLTIDEVKERLAIINPNIEILDDVYVDSRAKMQCRCLIDGYEWSAVWGSLQQGQGCAMCVGRPKLTIDEIKTRLKNINPNIEILDGTYTNAHTKLKCRCLIDGCEWGITWSNLFNGYGCPQCAIKLRADKKRLILQDIKNKLYAINQNIQIIDSRYKNANTKLKCKCLIDNYKWSATWGSLSRGQGCPKCGLKSMANKQRFNIEYVKNELMNINPNINILSDEYIDSETKLKCMCLIDGHKWDVDWNHLRQGTGCPKCANMGVRNEILAERNKEEWTNKKAIVYLIKCYNNNESFYKIGITIKTVRLRFNSNKDMPYQYAIIKQIFTNLYDAIYLENKLHELNKEFSYIPKIKFGGYTECFSEIKIFENVLE